MKRHISLLKHRLEDITDIKECTNGVDFDTFVSKSILKKSVCMSLINIGELAKTLPQDAVAKTVPDPRWGRWTRVRLQRVAAKESHPTQGPQSQLKRPP